MITNLDTKDQGKAIADQRTRIKKQLASGTYGQPLQEELGAQKDKRSWLSLGQSWLANLAFVLFDGVAFGVGFLFVLGLFAGPGTVGGEFVSLQSLVIVVACDSLAIMIRRKKGRGVNIDPDGKCRWVGYL